MEYIEEEMQVVGIWTFNFWFSLLRVSVSSFVIKKCSCYFNQNFRLSLFVVGMIFSCSINLSFRQGNLSLLLFTFFLTSLFSQYSLHPSRCFLDILSLSISCFSIAWCFLHLVSVGQIVLMCNVWLDCMLFLSDFWWSECACR